ncbi:MAG: LysR family transcriptional regulator [Alphaproteobacteria bacterium]
MHAAVLRYLDAVARHGSIRRASEHLNIAASAVNRQILKLEQELGTPLFERLPGGLRLTEAGTIALRHARATLFDYERLRGEIGTLQGVYRGLVRIASLDSLLVHLLPGVVEAVHAAHPGVRFQVEARGPGEIVDLVADGDVDIGLSFNLELRKNVVQAHDIPVPIMAIVAAGHPLAGRARVTLADCSAYPFIFQQDNRPLHRLTQAQMIAERITARPFVTSNSQPFNKRLIVRGLGVGFYTKIGFLQELAAGEVVAIPLSNDAYAELRLGLVLPQRQPKPAVTVVIRALTDALDALLVQTA